MVHCGLFDALWDLWDETIGCLIILDKISNVMMRPNGISSDITNWGLVMLWCCIVINGMPWHLFCKNAEVSHIIMFDNYKSKIAGTSPRGLWVNASTHHVVGLPALRVLSSNGTTATVLSNKTDHVPFENNPFQHDAKCTATKIDVKVGQFILLFPAPLHHCHSPRLLDGP